MLAAPFLLVESLVASAPVRRPPECGTAGSEGRMYQV